MAEPGVQKGTKVSILMGEGDPVAYTKYCGLTARSINFQTATNEVYVPDCDNPDDPAWRRISKNGRFVSISGSGLLDLTGAFERYRDAWADADPIPIRFNIGATLAQGGGYWTGNFHFTQLEVTGDDSAPLITANITLESDGPVTWVDASS